MPYIPFTTKSEAVERTRVMWTDILGREKHAEDVTTYLYGVIERSEDPEAPELPDGVDVAIAIAERDGYLDRLVREDQLEDGEYAALVGLYPAWASGVAYKIGNLCAYNDRLYVVVQAHTSIATWTPNIVHSLFVDRAPEGVIPAWVQPLGAHDAYPIGYQVTRRDYIWTSLIDANVWEPILANSALWQRGESTVPEPPPTAEWAYPVAYKIGDIVTYLGKTYSCRQAHTSISTWNPVAAASLWLLI